jgi:hypothetical protein
MRNISLRLTMTVFILYDSGYSTDEIADIIAFVHAAFANASGFGDYEYLKHSF